MNIKEVEKYFEEWIRSCPIVHKYIPLKWETNSMNLVITAQSDGLPPISTMLSVVKFNHLNLRHHQHKEAIKRMFQNAVGALIFATLQQIAQGQISRN